MRTQASKAAFDKALVRQLEVTDTAQSRKAMKHTMFDEESGRDAPKKYRRCRWPARSLRCTAAASAAVAMATPGITSDF